MSTEGHHMLFEVSDTANVVIMIATAVVSLIVAFLAFMFDWTDDFHFGTFVACILIGVFWQFTVPIALILGALWLIWISPIAVIEGIGIVMEWRARRSAQS